jgi:hypothetical protein
MHHRSMYTSFPCKGKSTLSHSPRSLCLSQFEPQRASMATRTPHPCSYDPKDVADRRSICIAKAARMKPDPPSLLGPGCYAVSDVLITFDLLCKKRRAIRKAAKKVHNTKSRQLSNNLFGEVGEPGQMVNGKALRTGIPGPQAYHPKYPDQIFDNKKGKFTMAKRFSHGAVTDIPGPGEYEDLTQLCKDFQTGVSFTGAFTRHRALPGYRDLRRECLAPGPGLYSPLRNRKGEEWSL